VLKGAEIAHAIEKYDIWSSYRVEDEGVLIAYTSVYGNTKAAAELLRAELLKRGCPKVALDDLAREDMHETVENAFRYGKTVFATTTYNGDVFPFMRTFIDNLKERGWKNRTVGIIENGTWAPMAAKTIRGMLEKSEGLVYAEPVVTVKSALDDSSRAQIAELAAALT
jgi:flavorubredoxin